MTAQSGWSERSKIEAEIADLENLPRREQSPTHVSDLMRLRLWLRQITDAARAK